MTLIRTVLYGSETWILRKAEETRFAVFQRKILRRLYGPCNDYDTRKWRIHLRAGLKGESRVPTTFY